MLPKKRKKQRKEKESRRLLARQIFFLKKRMYVRYVIRSFIPKRSVPVRLSCWQQIQICVVGHYQSEQYTSEIFREIIMRECAGVPCYITSVNTNTILYL